MFLASLPVLASIYFPWLPKEMQCRTRQSKARRGNATIDQRTLDKAGLGCLPERWSANGGNCWETSTKANTCAPFANGGKHSSSVACAHSSINICAKLMPWTANAPVPAVVQQIHSALIHCISRSALRPARVYSQRSGLLFSPPSFLSALPNLVILLPNFKKLGAILSTFLFFCAITDINRP